MALASSERALTWRELDEARLRLAAGYRALGLAPGDRLASLMPNRIDLAIHYLACFTAGLVATPLNYRYTAREIDHALEVSGAAALLVHAERAPDVAASGLAGRLPRGLAWYEGAGPGGPRFEDLAAVRPGPATPADPAAPAAIFFTSGSTGPAKGVTHTHETLGWMCASAAAAFELTPDGRVPAGLVDVARRLLPVDLRRPVGRRSRGRRPQLGGGGDAAAPARRAPHDPGDAPRGAGRPRA